MNVWVLTTVSTRHYGDVLFAGSTVFSSRALALAEMERETNRLIAFYEDIENVKLIIEVQDETNVELRTEDDAFIYKIEEKVVL